MKELPLYNSPPAIVDDADFDSLSRFKWKKIGRGYVARTYYDGIRRHGGINRIVYLHRQILSPKSEELVDHINHDKLDNRRCNLRIADYSTNGGNMPVGAFKTSGTSSRYKGVSWDKAREKWVAKIHFHQRHFNLGGYNEERQAGLAYNHAAIICFGTFACLNQLSP